ncbi:MULTISPECIES: sigma-54-dependent transcriptional regulator [unclassified Haematospirillum]|uniref:sigma-54-dependent transcriptional regulator n=1 Tax=unclassified Haematospirillum TaxID=2622088 RepID=UPI00143967F1|nr:MULTISPECIES: sigma-54 dependent transcriptional regulator [unclassified Haematospirillum]NKD54837.1 sigma-54-dependent Fis family transcriptional regulator [Haematospirillum sp. H4890]NKD74675.1 sigma-54-dependent Fis family transcriptional regulator [Haematospirillum sp. H4485]
MKAGILIVEDDPLMAERYAGDLAAWETRVAETGRQAMDILSQSPPDAVVLDVNLPDMNGLEILRHIRGNGMPCGVVVVTSQASVRLAVEALQAGADDFLVKPFPPERLQVTVGNVIAKQKLSTKVEQLTEQLQPEPPGQWGGFIGSSAAIRGVYRMIEAAAPSRATVFITGESGTGKELCAEAIHRASPRRNGPFVAVNCAAIPRDLMESELFGHLKGAFTGAIATRDGAASQADGGTLFLDEIGEMDINLQGKLLRFLQTGMVQKVGADKAQKVDIRVICATNRDPLKEVEEGRFREDLYYRLHVIPIHLPPLRERDGDALEIAQALLLRLAAEENKPFHRIARPAALAIAGHDWPGNVRQLENVLRSAIVLHTGEELTLDMLPEQLQAEAKANPGPAALAILGNTVAATSSALKAAILHNHDAGHPDAGNGPGHLKPLWLIEKEAIESAIHVCGGNIPRAAALLEISPSTIYRKKISWAEKQPN